MAGDILSVVAFCGRGAAPLTPAILNLYCVDVEKTIEFILQQQASMRMLVKNEELVKATQAELRELAAGHKELAAAQKVTETKLQGLIDAMRRGRNGSHRKN